MNYRMTGGRARRVAVVAMACMLSLVCAASATAATRAKVSAGKALAKGCHTKFVGDRAHTDVVRATSGVDGLVQARLKGRGDWDLGVFDAGTKRSVAGSAALRGNELAEGVVNKGQRLLVQACRFRGRASSARVSVNFLGVARESTDGPVQVVDVSTPTRADKRRLQGLGLDLTEHGDSDSVEVVLYGAEDAEVLRRNKFTWQVRIADLERRNEANRRADRRYRARAAQTGSQLPSGRTSYRRLPDYELELKILAAQNPDLVRPITLPYKTHQGRDVVGIEIATDPYNLRDGKPIFLNMGVHHAREWPSSEHSIEWAYELLTNYGEVGRTTRLVRATRNIVIPIINPDGFNISREAPDFPPETEFGQFSYEMKRKNCWPNPGVATGTCENSSQGRLLGVDPNRNYGGFWGGGGASTNPLSDTFRGTGPFSEPETQNVRALHSERQITNLITNHTYSNLVLRPPGVADVGFPLEEPMLEDLGGLMASHNGYANIPSFGLYDTTGTTEDWTFWSAGGIGYTFEIGPEEFHPPYQTGVVAEFLGLPPAEGAGQGGNLEAYYEMLEATADRQYHSVLRGRAPEGWTLTIKKSFMTATSPVWRNNFGTDIGPPQLFPDSLESEYRSDGERFDWHINPSTRPVVAGRHGRTPVAPPQAEISLANPPGQPAENTQGNYQNGAYESIPFTVGGPPEVDNGKMTVHIEWGNPNTDWDLYIVGPNGEVVTQSASFGDTTEDAVLFDPPPGQYTAHVVNFDQVDGQPFDDWSNGRVTFASPTPTFYGPKESWQLSCEDEEGRVRATRSVFVDRGDRLNVGRVCGGASAAKAARESG
jgi:hypothetical protein